MTIVLATKNTPHRDHRPIVQLCEGADTHIACSELGTQSDDFLVSKCGVSVLFATTVVARWLAIATFVNRVMHVIRMRTCEQMRRINARWIVAMMADAHASWDRAIVKFIRNAVSTFTVRTGANKAVAKFIGAASPVPAFIWAALVNLFPEAIFDRSDRSKTRRVSHYKTNRLTFGVSKFGIAAFGDGRWLSASAFTQFYRSIVWSMLAHVISPFMTSDHAGGRLQRCSGNSVDFGSVLSCPA